MLSLLNTYADGYVAVPVIHACKKQGLFEILQEKQWIEFPILVKELKANSGYLKVALHLLESLGWVLRNEADAYQITDAAQWEDLPEGLIKLYEISPGALFQSEELQELVYFWINFFVQQDRSPTALTHSSWTDRLAGPLFIPLLPELHQHAVMQNGAMLINLPSRLRKAVIELFVHYEWGKADHGALVLTELGNQLIERVEVIGIAASYRPLLAQMGELLFGNSAAVFKKQIDGTEGHIDRNRNVLASSFQHTRYFKDAEKQILIIFNQLPFEKQPHYIADMGCGDGTFLKKIYHAIKEKSERGKVLKEYPLILLGIDYNEVALQIAHKNLEALPHFLLQGDINDPQQLLRDLQEKGINDTGSVLHVRSFLDHNFHCTHTIMLDKNTSDFPLRPGSVCVDTQGEALTSSEVLEAWQQHLSRWSEVIHPHGLMILEAHCLSAALTKTYLGQSENFYFDHLHAFSKQYLIEAEIFLSLAARVGLFPRVQPLRYPKTLAFCRVTFSHFEKRHYQIRHACQQDLQQLEVLEQRCWPAELQTSPSSLMTRIQLYPQGQFVLELDGQIVGVVYSQRIANQDAVFTMTADTTVLFHQPDGSFVQLLAVNILPEMQKKHLGDQLLEWMLQRCSVMNGINAVVGVTLCKNYHLQHEQQLVDYIHARDTNGYLLDPILRFHELHGASIVGLVSNYRPNDAKNEGQGVLVYYDIHGRVRKEQQTDHWQKNSSQPGLLISTPEGSVNNIAVYIEMLIRRCLGQERVEAFSPDKPLWEMGLDSADLLEITLQVSGQYQLQLSPVFFFRYNTIQRIVTRLQEQLNQKSSQEIGVHVCES